MKRWINVLCAASCLVGSVVHVCALEFMPLTGTIDVSDYPIIGQRDVFIAMAANGHSIVVWADRTGRDGNDEGIFGQLFDPTGNKIDGNFQVNVDPLGRQTDPKAEFSPDGTRLVIAWESEQEALARLYSVSFDPFAITPLGDPFPISTLREASFGDNNRNISFFPDGSFVIGFMSWDGDDDGISARRFDADGTPRDPKDLFINGQIADKQTDCSVLALEDGSFIVVWSSRFVGLPWQVGTDADGNSIQLQIINPDGSARFKDNRGAAEVTVNSYALGHQEVPNLAMGADGKVLVVWEDGGFEDPTLPGDGSEGEIVGRFVNPRAATPAELFIGEQFVINQNTSLDVDEVWVSSVGSLGAFIVAYESDADPMGRPFIMVDGQIDESVLMVGLDAEGGVAVPTVVVPEDNRIGPNDDPYVAVGESVFGVVWTQEVPRLAPKKVFVRFFANPFPSPVGDWWIR